MGKERITVEIDSDLLDRLRAAGVDPQAYLERELRRKTMSTETPTQRDARWAQWRAENKADIDSYNDFIAEHGLWCEGYDPRQP